MKPDVDPENADLFDGRGGGSLHIFLARDPERWHVAEDTVALRFDFHPEDWQALFVGVLHVGLDEDDLQQLIDRNRYVEVHETLGPDEWQEQKFREATTEYPMLGRIRSVYDECLFFPDDLSELRGECLKLKSETTQPEAVKALRKLIYACDEAAKQGFSLIMSGD